MPESGLLQRLEQEFAPAIFVSAQRKMFLADLQRWINDFAAASAEEFEAELPISEPAKLARVHEMAHVLDRRFEEDKVILKLRARQAAAKQIRQLLANHSSNIVA